MPQDVHPQIQAIIDTLDELNVPMLQDISTEAARALMETMSAARNEDYPPPDVAEVENASTGAGYSHVPVRIYRTTADSRAPVIVFYHGGGHVIGGLDSYDTVARFLALKAQCTLVSVDYRMSPEYPFPAAVEDCYDATRWVADNAERLRIDPARLAVCGDSAGGNLAAVVALMARESGSPNISAQALIYPVIDYRGGTSSYERYGEGYGVLETDTVTWFMDRYLPDPALRDDWRACPHSAPSHAGLPPALVLTAECDVLHDECVAYAEQLNAAGVPVEYTEFAGMVHGFFSYLGLVDDAAQAHNSVAGFLRRTWS
ncbi:MAG: alpha/beta hydrolase [Hyphomicrobiales bacterium]|nr:alpha/beta hydrolase [Hyphomicrobiales bacterium]MCP4998031.1 alpha/beta hydrolase [Hyphomicrobiales bacterium]